MKPVIVTNDQMWQAVRDAGLLGIQPGTQKWQDALFKYGRAVAKLSSEAQAPIQLIERLEEWHERLDNVYAATAIPMPPQIHVQALKETVQRLRDEMAAVIAKTTATQGE